MGRYIELQYQVNKNRTEIELRNNLFQTDWDLFNVNLITMCDLNVTHIIESINKCIARWKKRHLTFTGKITVIKSVLLPIKHCFISLPSPTSEVMGTG